MDPRVEDVLAKFCAKGEAAETRPLLAIPFLVDGFVYATNGWALLRVSAKYATASPGGPSLDGLRVNWSLMDDYRYAVQLIPDPADPDRCADCEGYGSVVDCTACKIGVDGNCKNCNGTYEVGSNSADARLCLACGGSGVEDTDGTGPVHIGGLKIAAEHVRLVLTALPGAVWKADDNYAYFASGIFCGVVQWMEKD